MTAFTLTKKAAPDMRLWMRDDRGRLVQREPDRQAFGTPRAEIADLRVLGIGNPYETKGRYGPRTKCRVLFEIIEGASRKRDVGKQFTEGMTASLGDTSKLGQIWNATLPPIREGDDADPTDLIGKEVRALLSIDESVDDSGNVRFWTNLVDNTIKPIPPRDADDEDEDEGDAEPATRQAPAAKVRPATPARITKAADPDDEDEEDPFDVADEPGF